ncbi:sarcoplasmic calcium-binding proteins I: III: and IV-like protein [Dinothrombium tinctorium]|uniref:Sarcoplasmic calcium-binding proteins I: III: and IV-like protein n=2 Tax=Dinothrombium tinctorium TaxID=1965070 RepID=A0A3S4RCI8_9ACAR|nr:sarcoplasmic calcium-binding proteins I: III: and IV-like protein [Dinothrombium tinctorium]
MSADATFKHKHLFVFHNFWGKYANRSFLFVASIIYSTFHNADANKDGILSWEDFLMLAEHYTKLQRRGKLEKEVFDRWKSIFEKWWNQLTDCADYNKDTFVEFSEWIRFFEKLGQTTKSHTELPDFLKTYLQLFFLCMDSNKDGLFCVKDYKKYLKSYNMDLSRADDCFKYMLTVIQTFIHFEIIDFFKHKKHQEEDAKNENALTSDRFKELVYDFWVSKDPNSKGKYICGPFDSVYLQDLEKNLKKLT